jgi:Cof subfamily protein (haloacid dehalogenase superfamily)
MAGRSTHSFRCLNLGVRFKIVDSFPRLVAFDLDGTLLRSDGTVAPRVRAAITSLKHRGCVLVLATGRPWAQVERIAEDIGGVDYYVCLNGAVVVGDDGSRLTERAMSRKQTRTSAELARQLIPDIALAADMADGRLIWDERFTHDFPSDFAMEVMRVPDAVVAVDGPVLTWLLDCKEFDPLRAIEILKPRMPPGTEVRPSGLETPEIVASGVNKGSGLTEVAKICGVNASDAWVFGDGLNDLDMFGWAGCSVAMGNAHADVVAKADLVASSNDEDGVAVILESLL